MVLLVEMLQGRLSCYGDQRSSVYVSVCDSGRQVCGTGSQRRHADSRPTRETAVDPSHEGGGLLVPDSDEFDLRGLSQRVCDGQGFFARDLKDKFCFFILKTSN